MSPSHRDKLCQSFFFQLGVLFGFCLCARWFCGFLVLFCVSSHLMAAVSAQSQREHNMTFQDFLLHIVLISILIFSLNFSFMCCLYNSLFVFFSLLFLGRDVVHETFMQNSFKSEKMSSSILSLWLFWWRKLVLKWKHVKQVSPSVSLLNINVSQGKISCKRISSISE